MSNKSNREAIRDQPQPSGEGKPIIEMVVEDMIERSKKGERKYGEKLKANNGRDGLIDAYQEALDLTLYLRQEIEEDKKQVKKQNK